MIDIMASAVVPSGSRMSERGELVNKGDCRRIVMRNGRHKTETKRDRQQSTYSNIGELECQTQ